MIPHRRPSLPVTALARARRAGWVVALAAVSAVLGSVGACGAPAARAPHPAGSPSAAVVAGSASPASGGDITLAFAGDIHFMQRTATLLTDPATALGPVARVLSGADLAMVNLESAVTERGTPEPKQFHFEAPASAYQALRAAGVDVASIGNNHSLDYGQVGLADTLNQARAAGFPVIGAGRSAAEAYAPWTATVKGVRIAFIAVSQVHELESSWAARDNRPGVAMAAEVARAAAAVAAARQQADVVVVYVHWGQEGNNCPTAEMKAFAARMAAAGAAIVVGTHAHLLLGDGWLGGTYVAYGLGNFLWWRDDAWSNDTGVLTVTLRGTEVTGARLVPAVISRTTGQPLPVDGAEAARVTASFAALRRCTGLAASRG